MTLDCDGARPHLYALARGDDVPDDVRAHAETCASCRAVIAIERDLDRALDTLPRHRVPDALRARLEAKAAPRRRPWRVIAPAAALVALAIALVIWLPRGGDGSRDAVAREAVNDHLRIVYSEHPLEVAASDMHAVKPWFTGRLEFAPRVAFSGDDDFPLLGGSVGYVRDHKAAVMVFKRRLHTITLLVFPPEGLDWPRAQPRPVGRLAVVEEAARGFNVLLWRDGGLAYALVSDVNPRDLELLATRLNPE